MFHDDCVGSSEAIEQTWFAMLLVNDPNAELVGTLRPPRENMLEAALRNAFEERDLGVALEQPAGLRSRAPLWVASGLIVAALAIAGVLADALGPHVTLASASGEPAPARIGSTALVARDALPPAEPAAPSARPLRELLDVKPAATQTTAAVVARGVAHGKAAPTAVTKRAAKRKASRNWLATSRLASR